MASTRVPVGSAAGVRPAPRRALVVLATAACAGHVLAQDALSVRVDEPRAFGWFVGDRVVRRVHVELPRGWVLDEGSLPGSGRGGALELRRIGRQMTDEQHLLLELEYQVFLAPAEPKKIDLPSVPLRFDPVSAERGAAAPAPRELRVQQWPIVVTPLVMAEAPSARGFGEMRPDMTAPPLPTRRFQWVLAVSLGLAAVLLAFLALRPLVRRWWLRRHQPFASAWRQVRQALRTSGPAGEEAAWRAMHQGFDAAAGRVLLAGDAAAHARVTPHLAPLAARIEAFYAASRARFFGGTGGGMTNADLLALAAALRDAERAAEASVPMPRGLAVARGRVVAQPKPAAKAVS